MISANAIFSEFACYVPLLSLPSIFVRSRPCPPTCLTYRPRMSSSPPGVTSLVHREFKIGIVWQGNPGHSKDRERSFRLANLEPLPACLACDSSAFKKVLARSRSMRSRADFR